MRYIEGKTAVFLACSVARSVACSVARSLACLLERLLALKIHVTSIITELPLLVDFSNYTFAPFES